MAKIGVVVLADVETHGDRGRVAITRGTVLTGRAGATSSAQ